MTKWIRYDGPGHVLKVSDDLYFARGSAAPVDDEQAKTMLDNPEIFGEFTVIADPTAPASKTAPEKKPAETTDTKEK